MGAHWDGKIASEWNIRNKTWRDIMKLKHVQNGENIIVCRNQNKNKILCVVRQVMQTVNWVLVRRLRNVLLGQLGVLLWPSKTSREWETNRYALLSALSAIHHPNEWMNGTLLGMLWYTKMAILVHRVWKYSHSTERYVNKLDCCPMHVMRRYNWMLKLKLSIGGTDWDKTHVLESRCHNLRTND